MRIELRFGDQLATATIVGTSAAGSSPDAALQLDLEDRMGQAKSGRLPRPVDLTGVEPVFDPPSANLILGPSETLAIFYEDFGQSLPILASCDWERWTTGWTGSPQRATISRSGRLADTPRSDRSNDPDG